MMKQGALLALALVAAGLLRPMWPAEPWSFGILKSILPAETIASLDKSGDDLYRQVTGAPTGSTHPDDLPERGFLFNLARNLLRLAATMAWLGIYSSEEVTSYLASYLDGFSQYCNTCVARAKHSISSVPNCSAARP